MTDKSPIPPGNHWAAAGLDFPDRAAFSEFLASTILPAMKRVKFGDMEVGIYEMSEHHDTQIIISERKNISVGHPALKLNDRKSERWPLTLKAIEECPNKVEADLICGFHGASFSIFDTAYYANREMYRIGETYEFWLGALAYKAVRDKAHTITDKEGKEMTLSNEFSSLLPALKDIKSNAPEFVIRGPVREVENAKPGPYALSRFRAVACRPPRIDDPSIMEDLRFDVYALDKAIEGPAPGIDDALFSINWLQGKLAHG